MSALSITHTHTQKKEHFKVGNTAHAKSAERFGVDYISRPISGPFDRKRVLKSNFLSVST